MSQSRQTAIITGGASGLGRALALELAREGWHIAVADLAAEAAEATCAELRAAGGEAHFEPLDVAQFDQWQALRARLEQRWRHLDLLVNNAGVAVSGAVGVCPLDDWHWIMNINLYGGIFGCHTMVDWLKANPRGAHIINTASAAAFGSAPDMAAYNVTKAGMLALSETLYGELSPHNVGVTVVCPAFFATNLLTGGRFQQDGHRELALSEFRRSRMTAEDVAQAALRAMRRKQLYVVMPRQTRVLWLWKRAAPAHFLRRISTLFRQRAERYRQRAAQAEAEAAAAAAASEITQLDAAAGNAEGARGDDTASRAADRNRAATTGQTG